MKAEKKPIRWLALSEALLWLAPLLLALVGHICAYPKADLGATGPGFHIALMNDQTIRAQRIWHTFSENYWLFILYGVLLVGSFITLRILHIHGAFRFIIFVPLAIPGLWYLKIMAYLAGKLLLT
ncbi:MAG: hypothetical protein NTX40_08930 [Planctomycetota bacterium]|nr:hypothetical protein [Planctomycetota bacterium]